MRQPTVSPFAPAGVSRLDPAKFRDPAVIASGEPRARVAFTGLETLWINTGTLCNLACASCYIESSPTNDALAYLTLDELTATLDELAALGWTPGNVNFTGGEPFMNPQIIAMLGLARARGYKVLVLTNAMRPLRRHAAALLELNARPADRLSLRVSLDHHTRAVHEAERGAGTWDIALAGIDWLSANGFDLAIAGRSLPGESKRDAEAGFDALRRARGWRIAGGLWLFPAMDETADVAEISDACWGILGVEPARMMCASSRMLVKRRGAAAPTLVACTLLPYAPAFDLGPSLAGAAQPVALNHPHCARFCVLGGASCS